MKSSAQSKGKRMPYRFMILIFIGITFSLIYSFLPQELMNIKRNPDIEYFKSRQDYTFNFFSKCKKQVSNVAHCYNAYSAAVQLAESKNCTPSGIRVKRRFKQLVEHTTDDAIEDEIKRECAIVK